MDRVRLGRSHFLSVLLQTFPYYTELSLIQFHRISDLENGLLNLERQWERLLRQYAKKYPEPFKSLDPNVFGFSLLLYEMAVGTSLVNLSDLDKYPPNASKEVLNVCLFLPPS